MSVTATRTPRLTPPAVPTRKSAPRRRTLGQGASVVGRADRPVLRIVADDEGAPLLTRVLPGPLGEPASRSVVEPEGRSVVEPATHSVVEPACRSVVEPACRSVVEPACRSVVEPASGSVVEPASAASGVETQLRRVDLDDFFAAEYDGDDVSVQVARPRPSTLRLTRRGRLVVFGASLAAVLGLGFVAATGSLANNEPEPTKVVTVEPGQTLWDISSDAATRTGSSDVRSMMSHLEATNHLDTTTLQVGQTLRVPK